MKAVVQKIAHQRRLRRSSSFARWLVVGTLLSLAPLVIGVATDSSQVLDKPWRWTIWGLIAVAVLRLLITAGRALHAPRDQEIARLLDEHAGMKDGYAVSTSLALSKTAGGSPEEQALLGRLHEQAAKLALASSPKHPWPKWWQVGGALVAVAFAAVLFSGKGPLPFQRVLMPWKDLTYTTISLSGPEKLPLADEEFEVKGMVHGRIPASLILEQNGAAPLTVPVSSDGSFRYDFEKGVSSSITLTAHCEPDGISPAVTVKLRNLPQPASYAHQVTPPDYAGAKVRTESQASFSILRASSTLYVVNFDKPATKVRLIVDHEPVPINLTNSREQSLTWKAKLGVLPRSMGYHLEIAEEDGVFRAIGESQQILMVPDKPPVVDILSHNDKDLKSPTDSFKMKINARDDVGLAGMRVIYYRVGDPDQRKVTIPVKQNELSHDSEVEIPLGSLKVAPHDVIVVIAQAVDNNTLDGPGIGSAEPLMIEVPDDPGAGGGGGGGGSSEKKINPLAIEKKIYRDTLMLSLGRSSATSEDLTQRQTDNNKNMIDMAEAVEGEDMLLGAQLRQAQREGVTASKLLGAISKQAGGGFVKAVDQEARVVSALALAARMMKQNPPQEGESKISYSLDEKQSAQDDPATEEEKIKKALAELAEAQAKQDELNAKLEKDGKDGQLAKEGEGKGEGEGTGKGSGKGEGGEGQGEGGMSDEERAEAQREQLAAQSESERIRDEIARLRKGANGVDPAAAAQQLDLAAKLQGQAAGSSMNPAGKKFRPGFESSKAIAKARVITESLLSGKVDPSATAEEAPPVYQGLIQQYSRRLSYDQ